jgi:multiple sugar transport system substrate-binding protein
MKKQLFVLAAIVLAATMVLAACGPAATTAPPATQPPATQPPATQPPATEAPTKAPVGPAVQIRWFIGIGTGADPGQVPIEEQVVQDFNDSQNAIHVNMEVIPNASSRDTLSTEIAAGAGPDIVGPVGWIGSIAFAGSGWTLLLTCSPPTMTPASSKKP